VSCVLFPVNVFTIPKAVKLRDYRKFKGGILIPTILRFIYLITIHTNYSDLTVYLK
jgi:hypothetical protein